MNKDKQNLLSILDAINKIENYITPFDNADDFYKNTVHFDAVMMNFVVIGEMVVRLSDEFREKYHQIDWFKIKGFRNIIAHDYFGIDAEEVWQIATSHLVKLKKEILDILKEDF